VVLLLNYSLVLLEVLEVTFDGGFFGRFLTQNPLHHFVVLNMNPPVFLHQLRQDQTALEGGYKFLLRAVRRFLNQR